METTASCEGGKPWSGSRPSTPSRSRPPSRPPTPLEREAATIPPPQDAQEIYLEGALPSQAQLLVAESETEAHKVIFFFKCLIVLRIGIHGSPEISSTCYSIFICTKELILNSYGIRNKKKAFWL